MNARKTSKGPAPRPVLDRIADRVALTDAGCLEWLGPLSYNGYGEMSVGSRTDGTMAHRKTHRLLYELLHGPVADGLDLDHLCRNRACCHPDHLEPVTRRENLRRGEGSVGRALRRNHCIHGHAYTEANTLLRNGARTCRACKAAQQQRLRDRRRAA